MALKIKVWPARATGLNPVEAEGDYLSLINEDTYGKPPLLTANEGRDPIVRPGQTVIYINPTNIAAVQVERTS